MKITDEHLAALRAAIVPCDTPERREAYLRGDFHNADRVKDLDMRYRWDLLYASGLKIGDGVGMEGLPLYGYLNDDHIDTALRSIVPVLAKPAAEQRRRPTM